MAKRRTKKQKSQAKHSFTLNWQPEPKTSSNEAVVKGQFKKTSKKPKSQKAKNEKAKLTGKNSYIGTIRRDTVRSIILASLILSLEVVVYLILR